VKWLIGLAALVACKSATPARDDCQIVLGDPAHATAEISKRYAGNPVKIAEVIERCVAPTGDDCERIAAIVKAIPTMMANPPAHSSGSDYLAVCRGLTPAIRHCLLPSYLLAHHKECAETPIDHLDITPHVHPAVGEPGTISLYVTRTGVWLGTGTDRAGRCFATRKAGALDLEWLEHQLHRYDGRDRPDIEVAAEEGASYQDVIAVMDTATKRGLTNVLLVEPGELSIPLSIPLSNAAEAGAPSDCAGESVVRVDAGSNAAPALPPATGNALATAPVVIASKTGITLRAGDHDTPIGSMPELASALPVSPSRGMIILQADRDTPAGVITGIVKTVKARGYLDVMFAVKR
jgi:biopolymer transport protein ExbD